MQRIMLYQLRTGGNPELYWLHTVHAIGGAGFDASTFERAWQRLVHQHPALRTSFLWEGLEEPLQIVHEQVELPLHQEDWRALSTAEQEARLDAYVGRLQRQGCDLLAAPQTRLALFHVADDLYQCAWSFNYMLQDGWSASLITRDLQAFYDALHRGQEIHLTPPPHYRRFISWQQQQDLASAQEFWRRQ
jgi:hypothetical protein